MLSCASRFATERHSAKGPRPSYTQLGRPTSHRFGAEMADDPIDVLDAYRVEAGLSHGELWLRYFELGGMGTGFELETFLYGLVIPDPRDHDVIAHALNERFSELGEDHPVAYLADVRGT